MFFLISYLFFPCFITIARTNTMCIKVVMISTSFLSAWGGVTQTNMTSYFLNLTSRNYLSERN